ncbi:MAG: hypothetical protein ACRC5C_03720, partial [Bacilli bacterium]
MTRDCLYCGETIYEVFGWWQLYDPTDSVFCVDCQAKSEERRSEKRCAHCQKVSDLPTCADCTQHITTGFTPNNTSVYSYDEYWKAWLERYKLFGDIAIQSLVTR